MKYPHSIVFLKSNIYRGQIVPGLRCVTVDSEDDKSQMLGAHIDVSRFFSDGEVDLSSKEKHADALVALGKKSGVSKKVKVILGV